MKGDECNVGTDSVVDSRERRLHSGSLRRPPVGYAYWRFGVVARVPFVPPGKLSKQPRGVF